MKKFLNQLLLVVALTLPIGCNVGCNSARPLDPTGPYGRIDATHPAPQTGLTLGQQLVQVDQAIVGAKSLMDGFMLWEHNNRSFINSQPIKDFAKRLEIEGPRALQSATRLRDAYAAAPTDENRTVLEASLGVIDALLLELANYRPAP